VLRAYSKLEFRTCCFCTKRKPLFGAKEAAKDKKLFSKEKGGFILEHSAYLRK
jgi:hypothetical protein